jgi:hypothetical protein
LVVAAIASVLEGDLNESYSILFPQDRPFAVQAALLAVVLALAAIAVFACKERNAEETEERTGSAIRDD